MKTESVYILLIGGGFTLERLARTLPSGSFVITSRSAKRCAAWREMGWHAAEFEMRDTEGLVVLLKRYPAVHVMVDGVPPLRSNHPAQGVQSVCAALNSSVMKRVIYLSTSGVFGKEDGEWVDEGSPASPVTPQSLARLHCEEAYARCFKEHLILRVPAIYGYERGLARSLEEGRYRLVGDGMKWTNRVHVDDLIAVIRMALTAELPGEVLCIGDNEPLRARDAVQIVCERYHLPWPGSITEEDARIHGHHTLLLSQRIRNDLMRSFLGVPLSYPTLRDGLGVRGSVR